MGPADFPAPRAAPDAEVSKNRRGADFAAPRHASDIEVAENRAVRIAQGQRGIIRLEELETAGLSRDQVTARARAGWLVRLHEGIYALGTVGAIGRTQAGLWACGPDAIVDDESSAALHDLLPYPDAVHVSVPRNGPRPKGVVTKHRAQLPAWTRRHGLKTATVPETLLALAARSRALAMKATDQAFIARRTSTAALLAFLTEKGGRRGVRALREIVEGPRTRSHLEKLFWRLLKDARLPLPLTNVKVNGHLVDFFWPDYGLIVETDGWASHGRRGQWEHDHDRDLDHFLTRIETLRITARQLEKTPYAITAALAVRLSTTLPETFGLRQRREASVLLPATAAS